MPNVDGRDRPIPTETEGTTLSEPNSPSEAKPNGNGPKAPQPRSTANVGASTGAPPAPRTLAALHRDKRLQREWFARIRIREDRLARLWVSNLAGHDVVVWSKKEKRWVALLAVPELRRALEAAQSELPRDGRRPTSVPPSSMSRPPDSLPPTPPLAQMDAAAAGIGELRLRSIAQGQSVGPNREISRASFPPLLPPQAQRENATSRQQRLQPLRHAARVTPRSKPWQWRALERIAWVAAGVLGMFVLSSSGSAGENAAQFEPASVLLTADRLDPSFDPATAHGNGPTLGDLLAGPPQQCRARPTYGLPCSTSPDAEPPPEVPSRESTSAARPRTIQDGLQRSRSSAPARLPPDSPAAAAEVPPDLNFPAIRAALFNAAALARSCPGENISGKTVVTFEPDGSVRSVDIPLLVGEKPDRKCIVRSFKTVRVPPFTGHPVAVKKDF